MRDSLLLSVDPFEVGALTLSHYISSFHEFVPTSVLATLGIKESPWHINNHLPAIIAHVITTLSPSDYKFYILQPSESFQPATLELRPDVPEDATAADAYIAIHISAVVE